MTTKVFSSMNENSALFGWGWDEQSLVMHASLFSILVHASDWAINLSTLTNYEAPAQQKTHSTAKVIPNTHTATFLWTDGDNIQWLLNDFATASNWFGSPDRGTN